MKSSQRVNSEQKNVDDYEEGNYDLALIYKENNMIRKLDENGRRQEFEFCVGIDEIGKQLGVGIELYFRFLKFFTIVFFVMSLCAVPGIYNNFISGGQTSVSAQNYLLQTMLANQPQLKTVYPYGTTTAKWSTYQTAIKDANYKILKDFCTTQLNNFYFTAGSDLLATIVFLISLLIFQYVQNQAIEQNKNSYINLIDYSLKFKSFPETVINEEDLITHFSQFGEVIEAGFARNYHGTLNNFKNEAEIMNQILAENKRCEINKKRSKFRLNLLLKEKQRIHEKTLKTMKGDLKGLTHDEFPSLWAYVVFNRIQDRNEVRQQYLNFNKWTAKRVLCNCLWSLKEETPSDYKLGGEHTMLVEEPNLPSDIKWDNQEVGAFERIRYLIFSYIMIIIMFAITFAIIIFASNSTKSLPSCTIQYDQLYIQGTFNPLTQGSSVADSVVCYCTQIGKTYYNTLSTDVCYDAASFAFKVQINNYVASIVIVVTNMILTKIIFFLSKFERYSSNTHECYTSMSRLTVVLFINTALLAMLLNSNINNFIFTSQFINIIPAQSFIKYDSTTASKDLDVQWYVSIGNKVATSLIIMIFNPNMVEYILNPIFNCVKSCMARCEFLQKDMNEAILPDKFDLTQKYSIILNAVMVVMLYSTGMPHLYIVGFFIFLLTYIFQKHQLLRAASRPINYSEYISVKSITFLKFAIILKTCFALWTYTTPSLFPVWISSVSSADLYNSQELILQATQNTTTSTFTLQWTVNSSYIYQYRISRNILYTLILAGVIAVTFAEGYIKLILQIVKQTLYYLFCCCFCNKDAQIQSEKVTQQSSKDYNTEYENLKLQGCTTYKIRENKEYKQLVYALDFQDVNDVQQMKLSQKSQKNTQIQQLQMTQKTQNEIEEHVI